MPSLQWRQALCSWSVVLGSLLETYRHHRPGMDGFRLYNLLLVSWLAERLQRF